MRGAGEIIAMTVLLAWIVDGACVDLVTLYFTISPVYGVILRQVFHGITYLCELYFCL